MVFQNPMSSFNPVWSIGAQLQETVTAHDRRLTRREARGRAEEALQRVGLPSGVAGKLPSELSGGMLQRAMIATAIVNRPSVIVADEPVTALDVTVRAQILELLREVLAQSSAGQILVTHDLGAVAEMADRVLVLYAGRLVETADVGSLFSRPRHPYSAALLASRPLLDQGGESSSCRRSRARRRARPTCRPAARSIRAARSGPAASAASGRCQRCARSRWCSRPLVTSARSWPGGVHVSESDPLLEVEDIAVHFHEPARAGAAAIRAVDGVSLSVGRGETLAALELLRQRGLTTAEIAGIRVGMATLNAEIVDDREMPSICLQDMLSLGLVRGRLLYDDAHEDGALADPEVRRLRGLVEIVPEPAFDADRSRFHAAWVEFDTADGRTFRSAEHLPPGNWATGGLGWADVEEKFTSLVEPRLGAAASAALVELVRQLETQDDLSELGRQLSLPVSVS